MALYFENKLKLPSDTGAPTVGKRVFLDVTWHKAFPLLAIAHCDERNGGLVSIYNHSTEETSNVEASVQQGSQVVNIRWHPTKKILAMGYQSGEVVVWNHEEGECFEGPKGHNSAVMLMEWSADGSVLVSSDSLGFLVIWCSDAQGHLQTQAVHDFKDPVCQIVFRGNNFPGAIQEDENERALGMMTSWRPKTGVKRRGGRILSRQSNHVDERSLGLERCFFAGVLSGTIFYLKENGSKEDVLSSGSAVRSLLYHGPKDILIVMTEAFIMGQFTVDANGDLQEISKMKLSGEGDVRLYWIGMNTLAVLCNEPYIRLWDVDTSENIVIEPKDKDLGDDEVFLSIDYSAKNSILCCCTSKGRLVMWKETETSGTTSSANPPSKTSEDHWEWYNSTTIPNSSKLAAWCQCESGLLAVNAIQEVLILKEQELSYTFASAVSCVQTSPQQVTIHMFKPKLTFDIKTDMQVKGMTTSGDHVVLWNGMRVSVFEIGPNVSSPHYKNVGGFQSKCDNIAIHEQNLYTLESSQIQVRTFQGTVKQTLSFTAQEGSPITMTVGGDYIVCGTENGFIKVWHIGRREAKLHMQPKDLNKIIDNFGEIIHAVTNSTGEKVAVYVAQLDLIPDSRLFIIDLNEATTLQITITDRFITKLFWEPQNAVYLAIETKLVPLEFRSAAGVDDSFGNSELLTEDDDEGGGEGRALQSSMSTITNASNFGVGGIGGPGQQQAEKIRKATMNISATTCDQVIVSFFLDPQKFFLIHELREVDNGGGVMISGVGIGIGGGDDERSGSRASRRSNSSKGGEHLVGLEVPYLYLTRNCGQSRLSKKPSIARIKELERQGSMRDAKSLKDSSRVMIERDPITDFDGIEDEEREGREALVKYVHSILVDDIDGALNATRSIRNQKVYNNMLRNCLKTRRLDVAFICLSKLRNVRVCQILRETMDEEPEEEAHVAMLAIQLGLIKEAEELYKSCGRYDLLLDLYIISEQWDEAVALCESHRRIQLKSTYHAWGKCLEKEKKTKEAIKMYERAETHRYEVPRMLSDDPQQLEQYVINKKDKELYQWWAQYLESSGDTESALQYYEFSQDWLSLVRLLCFLGDHEKAVLISERVGDRASAYHLARTLEDRGDVAKSISFYYRAGALGHAVRICKDNGLVDELWRVALKAEAAEQADAAKYFETVEPPMYSRAIQLYHKAGYGSKALDLAFETSEFGALQMVVRDIVSKPNHNTDPLLLQRCADFFVDNNEIEKAIDMLVAAQKYPEAMDLCVKKKFIITEDIAERLTAPKGAGIDETTRKMLLEKMGESLTFQGSYQLAAKKYTQAGNKIQAMKSLLKSGDTEKIKFYADICRHREIYVLAANYMQTTDLRKNQKLIPTIVQYYNKAQAYDSLAAFYETLAQSEIEDKRDYKSALHEYRKVEGALKQLVENGSMQYEEKLRAIQTRIFNIHKFISVKDNFARNPEISMQELKRMKEDGKLDGIRLGDMYAMIIEYLVQQGQLRQGVAILDEMKSQVPNVNLSRYLSPETMKSLEKVADLRSTKPTNDFSTTAINHVPEKVESNPGDDILQLLKYNNETKTSAGPGDEEEDEDEEEEEETGEEEEEVEEEEEIEDEDDDEEEDEGEEEEYDNQQNPSFLLQQQQMPQQRYVQQMYGNRQAGGGVGGFPNSSLNMMGSGANSSFYGNANNSNRSNGPSGGAYEGEY